MITSRAIIYLIYAALVLFTFLGDKLLKKTDKTSRTLGYVICIIGDLGILGNGLLTYFKYKETNYEIASQTGFVLGGILFGVCVLCLLGRYWQNKELDKRRKKDQES
ncbi:MAG: hypothetical protein J6P73_06150 [Bacteroidales bacterium]|nr:hypothetical protein [Bacteroidales bacterium]